MPKEPLPHADLTISVVIPVLNDAGPLRSLLSQLNGMQEVSQIVVSDGGSSDSSREVALELGAVLVESPRGRGAQMNLGAREASGNVLWFLHADNTVESQLPVSIRKILCEQEVIGGAFRFHLSERRWYGPAIHAAVGIRSRVFHLPFGDQGLFVRRDVFETIGGYKPLPVMEDVDLVLRLRKAGRLVISQEAIGVSPRRWDREGILHRTILNWRLVGSFLLGLDSAGLERLYPPDLQEDKKKAPGKPGASL
jgi:rSAM/selenodomain-associated transferase 2